MSDGADRSWTAGVVSAAGSPEYEDVVLSTPDAGPRLASVLARRQRGPQWVSINLRADIGSTVIRVSDPPPGPVRASFGTYVEPLGRP